MVKLDRLADALSGLRPVQVQRRRCLASLSPHAVCTACRDICPEDAIALAPAPKLSDCSGCGLCAAVCPGDALTLDDPSDHQLLQQLTVMARRHSTVSLSCQGAGVKVTCPGRVSAELILAAVAAGAQRVELVCPEASCSTCRYRAGRPLAQGAAACAAAVLAALGRPETVAIAEIPSPQQAKASQGALPIHQDRRDFLLAAFGLLRRSAPAIIPGAGPASAPPADADAAARSPRRDLLLWACETLKPDRATPVNWPGRRPTLATPCHHCAICVRLCPGQALSLTDQGLSHLPRRCMNCGLCATVCPAGAVQMGAQGPLHDLTATAPAPLGEARTLTCPECSGTFAATAAAGTSDTPCLPCHVRGSNGKDWLA